MGIPRGTARLLLDESRERPFAGSILELGRMSVYVTAQELESWAKEQGVALAAGVPAALSHQPELAQHGCIDDRSFFRLLGFDVVESADVADWEGVDHIVDLNQPVPESLRGRYDVVFEGGTIQHVFDLPRVFSNIHELLRVGGRVIHGMAPSSNHVDHGFHMFSPTLFHDFYSANGWRIEKIVFFEFYSYWLRGRFRSTVWKIRPYTPGCLDGLAYGGFGGAQIGLFVVATKIPGATADRSPQQTLFSRLPPTVIDRAPTDRLPALPEWVLLPLKYWRRRLKLLLPRRLPLPVKRY